MSRLVFVMCCQLHASVTGEPISSNVNFYRAPSVKLLTPTAYLGGNIAF